MTREIAVYGVYRKTVFPRRERRLVTRLDGIKQHYWYGAKKPRLSGKIYRGRYEFHGEGRDLYKAVVNAHQVMPRGHISVSARRFNANPERYGVKGRWVKYEVVYEPWKIELW